MTDAPNLRKMGVGISNGCRSVAVRGIIGFDGSNPSSYSMSRLTPRAPDAGNRTAK